MVKNTNVIPFRRSRPKFRRVLKWCAVVAVISFCSILSTSLYVDAGTDSLSGTARVIDGDTLEIKGQRIRIHGIDAPESAQTCLKNSVTWLCGKEANKVMSELVRETETKCQAVDKDRYGRIVAKCFSNDRDVGAELVSAGLALAYRQYSNDYVDAEASAKASMLGLWAGEFIEPWDWRRGKRLVEAPANDNQPCQIKGNISRSGERIYHVPGGAYYSRTKISENKGERWFCSEDEARQAGWRKSSR